MTPLDNPRYQELLKLFRATREKYSRFGAADSEVGAVYERLEASVLRCETTVVPTRARAWELYDDKDGVDEAATALADAARAALRALLDGVLR